MKQPSDGKEAIMLIMMEYAITGLDFQSARHLSLWLFPLKSMEMFLFKCLVSIKMSHLHDIKMKMIRWSWGGEGRLLNSLVQQILAAQTNYRCCEKRFLHGSIWIAIGIYMSTLAGKASASALWVWNTFCLQQVDYFCIYVVCGYRS